jgi:hypothetical protein
MSLRIRSLLQGPLPLPVSPQDIYRQQGSASMPGTDAAAEAKEQDSADWQRFLAARKQQAAEMPRGMGISERQARHAADMATADYGPMDGSKPPAEAFLPAEKSYDAPLGQDKIIEGRGGVVPSSPEEKAKAVAASVVSGGGYEAYKERERARSGRLKELGMMHENQNTVLPEEEWMKMQGKSTGPVDMSEATAAAVAENREKFGDWRSDPRYSSRVNAGQRRAYMNRIAKQYASEIAENPQLLDALMAEYDSGIASAQGNGAKPNGSGTMHGHGAAAARNITDKLDARDLAQRQLNVQANWDQINQGRMHGVPRGFIAAQQEINNAMAAGDDARASAIAATYGRIYGPQFLAWSLSTNERLGKEAAADAEVRSRQKPAELSPMDQYQKDQAALRNMPAGPARSAAMRWQIQQSDPTAKPEQVQVMLQTQFQPIAFELIQKPVEQWTPEERSEFAANTQGMTYEEMRRYLSLPDDEAFERFYENVTGKKKPTWWPWS